MQHYPSIFIFPFICLRRTDFISLTTPCDGMQANSSTGLPETIYSQETIVQQFLAARIFV